MAFTKIVGAGIHTLSNVHTHNVNSSGIITATSFVGPLDGTNGDFSGNVTIDGNLVVNGDTTTLNTTLREVEILRVDANNSTVGAAITQSGSGDILRLYDGASQVVTVDDEGNVGIRKDAPGTSLHVRSTATGGGNIAYFDDTGSGVTGRLMILTTDGVSGGGIKFQTVNKKYTYFGTSTNKLTIDNNNSRVGIGTDNPLTELHVHGETFTDITIHSQRTSGNIGGINFRKGGVTSGIMTAQYLVDVDGSHYFYSQGSQRLKSASDGDLTITGSDNAELKLKAGTSTGNDIIAFQNSSGTTKGNIFYDTDHNFMVFKTNGTASSNERLRINSSGQVGINEASNINARLHVQHDALNENILYATRYDDQTNDKPILGITEAQMSGMISSGLVIGNHNRDIHIGPVFDSSAAVTTTDLTGIRINNDGKIGIGVSSPNAIIEASVNNASIGYYLKNTNTTSGFGLRVEGGGTTADRYSLAVFNAAGEEAFRVNANKRVGIGSAIPTDKLDIQTGSSDEVTKFKVKIAGQLELTRNHASAPYIKTFMSSGNPAIHLGDSSGDKAVIKVDGDSYLNGGNFGVGTNNPNYKTVIQTSDTTAYSASTITANQFQLAISNSGANGVAGILLATEPSSGNGGHCGIRALSTGSGDSALTFSTRGSATSAERLRIDSNGRLSFAGDTDTYIWHPEDNELAITVSGGSQPIARFGTGGNNATVGINTTANLVTNSEILSVRGYSSFKSTNYLYAALYTHNESQGGGNICAHILFNVGGANRGGFGYGTDNSTLIMGNHNAISFRTGVTNLNGTERLHIRNDGKIGINQTPDAAGGLVQIRYNEVYTSGTTNLLTSASKAALRIRTSSDSSKSLYFGGIDESATPYLQVGNMSSASGGATAVYPMVLQPYGGNIGINQTNPNRAKLHVVGGTANPDIVAKFKGSSGADARTKIGLVAAYPDTANDTEGHAYVGALRNGSGNTTTLFFEVSEGSSLKELARVDNSGIQVGGSYRFNNGARTGAVMPNSHNIGDVSSNSISYYHNAGIYYVYLTCPTDNNWYTMMTSFNDSASNFRGVCGDASSKNSFYWYFNPTSPSYGVNPYGEKWHHGAWNTGSVTFRLDGTHPNWNLQIKCTSHYGTNRTAALRGIMEVYY